MNIKKNNNKHVDEHVDDIIESIPSILTEDDSMSLINDALLIASCNGQFFFYKIQHQKLRAHTIVTPITISALSSSRNIFERDVICSDGKGNCPNGNICCSSSSDQWCCRSKYKCCGSSRAGGCCTKSIFPNIPPPACSTCTFGPNKGNCCKKFDMEKVNLEAIILPFNVELNLLPNLRKFIEKAKYLKYIEIVRSENYNVEKRQ
ncbi:5780_t:CDS:2 [Cetraspora pellucida]|uniref:5780_t:CDS:1 n=1 Tax=Cetraspora pellucida TaxID=1433469 RepID=A0ACA9KKM8_9GLOM|nr:5780_t:CDS:2 [Cetraspora pellucida]